MKENKVFQKFLALVKLFIPFCNLSDYIKTTGRKLSLSIIDFVAIGLFKHFQGILTKKSVFETLNIQTYCSYKTLCVNTNYVAPIALQIIGMILAHNRQLAHVIKHTDSSELPVCLKKNMDSHKTMKGIASMGKSSKGWYYGMKFHLTSDFGKRMLKIRITTASASDRKVAEEINQDLWGVIILDSGYVKDELRDKMNVEGKRWWIVKPYKTMKEIATIFENLLYNTRMMIEAFFRDMKLFRGLVSSIPRSVNGYLANYTYAILAEVVRPLMEDKNFPLLLSSSNNQKLLV